MMAIWMALASSSGGRINGAGTSVGRWARRRLARVDLLTPAVMEVAVFLAAHGGASALHAVGLDVLASRNAGFGHECGYPPLPPAILWNHGVKVLVFVKQ